MNSVWKVYAKKADFNKWAEEFHISPVLARILRNRDLNYTKPQRGRMGESGTLH